MLFYNVGEVLSDQFDAAFNMLKNIILPSGFVK